MFLVFSLVVLNRCCRKALFRKFLYNASKNLFLFLWQCLLVLRSNVGFRLVFKSVYLNLASSCSCIPSLVDCFWSHYNYFHQTIFLNFLRASSMSYLTGFGGCYGTDWSEG